MRNLLDIKLLSQPFETTADAGSKLENARLIAQMYTKMENCLSVLSDMKARKSYIYYGAIAEELGLAQREAEIMTIWEDYLLDRVHPEDLQKKYRLEFQYFQLLNTMDVTERIDHGVITKLRIRNKDGKYIHVKHRLLYIGNWEDGSIWLALCLYDLIGDHPEFDVPQGVIINSRTGKVTDHSSIGFTDTLSTREKEIMLLVKHGRRSKEIADKLQLSINTVNRHRQNIFQKLNVGNAMEACRVAENMGLL